MNNGTVIAVLGGGGGDQQYHGLFPNYGQSIVPAGLTNVVAIAVLWLHEHGIEVGWRSVAAVPGRADEFGASATVSGGLNNVVAIANGLYHSLAALETGGAVAWGNNVFGETNVPAGLTTYLCHCRRPIFQHGRLESPLSINLSITPITGGSPQTNSVAANSVTSITAFRCRPMPSPRRTCSALPMAG